MPLGWLRPLATWQGRVVKKALQGFEPANPDSSIERLEQWALRSLVFPNLGYWCERPLAPNTTGSKGTRDDYAFFFFFRFFHARLTARLIFCRVSSAISRPRLLSAARATSTFRISFCSSSRFSSRVRMTEVSLIMRGILSAG